MSADVVTTGGIPDGAPPSGSLTPPGRLECSLEGCPSTEPHMHVGDDELVRLGPPPRMSVPVRARAGRLVPPDDGIAPRPFFLLRFTDVSGVSGEGVIAYGVRFASGKIALEWCVPGLPSSVGIWDCLDDVRRIHGHGNNTVVRWLDGGDD